MYEDQEEMEQQILPNRRWTEIEVNRLIRSRMELGKMFLSKSFNLRQCWEKVRETADLQHRERKDVIAKWHNLLKKYKTIIRQRSANGEIPEALRSWSYFKMFHHYMSSKRTAGIHLRKVRIIKPTMQTSSMGGTISEMYKGHPQDGIIQMKRKRGRPSNLEKFEKLKQMHLLNGQLAERNFLPTYQEPNNFLIQNPEQNNFKHEILDNSSATRTVFIPGSARKDFEPSKTPIAFTNQLNRIPNTQLNIIHNHNSEVNQQPMLNNDGSEKRKRGRPRKTVTLLDNDIHVASPSQLPGPSGPPIIPKKRGRPRNMWVTKTKPDQTDELIEHNSSVETNGSSVTEKEDNSNVTGRGNLQVTLSANRANNGGSPKPKTPRLSKRKLVEKTIECIERAITEFSKERRRRRKLEKLLTKILKHSYPDVACSPMSSSDSE